MEITRIFCTKKGGSDFEDIEIELAGAGAKRRFRGGNILPVEDTWGAGHRNRTTDGKLRRSIFIRLDA